MLFKNSLNEAIFNAPQNDEETAGNGSGVLTTLACTINSTKNVNRKRNIVLFNQPYNKDFKGNVGKIFITLLH